MSKMEIQYRVLGAIGTNVYFLINKETKETLSGRSGGQCPLTFWSRLRCAATI